MCRHLACPRQGAPGTGKTTLLRDVAHLLADTFQCVLRGSCISGGPGCLGIAWRCMYRTRCLLVKCQAGPLLHRCTFPCPTSALNPHSRNVVVVDTSNEVAGDASVPHPCIGSARRMMVRDKRMQHDTMVEATANHNPDVS